MASTLAPSLRLASALLIFVTGCGSAGTPAPRTPDNLRVPAGQAVLLQARGKGAQIYVCAAKAGEAGAFAWTLKAPEAELFDAKGQPLGKHYAGPTWEAADGSKVVAEVKERADAPDPGAIPWLLLAARSHEGAGVLAAVKSIQRVDTSGGKAPAEGCDAAHVGTESRVSYAATYYFYGDDPKGE